MLVWDAVGYLRGEKHIQGEYTHTHNSNIVQYGFATVRCASCMRILAVRKVLQNEASGDRCHVSLHFTKVARILNGRHRSCSVPSESWTR